MWYILPYHNCKTSPEIGIQGLAERAWWLLYWGLGWQPHSARKETINLQPQPQRDCGLSGGLEMVPYIIIIHGIIYKRIATPPLKLNKSILDHYSSHAMMKNYTYLHMNDIIITLQQLNI